MMRISPFVMALLAALGMAASLRAQAPTPTPAGPKNLVGNGGFETSFTRENLWDGVDKNGYISGERGSVPILTTSGVISDSAMPISVGVADMNADGLPDLVTIDVLGYLRIFFNSGTKTEPKFTIGELGGIFLSRTDPNDPILGGAKGAAVHARFAPRLYPTDIMHSGKKDLIIGNYLGEIFLVPNQGSAQAPDFKQPSDLSRIAIPTMKDANKRWGNVFAPCTWDWNKDGKEDLLLGEGSYSANNIHLLLNQGTGAKPAFDESNRYVLAYGGIIDPPNIPALEQLTPTVVDYNGDGLPDLLVADRTGKIAVYLNKGEQPKLGAPPPELPFASFISSATGSTPMTFGSISTVSTGDLNGDGLFDLVVGKTNGRIAVAMNVGTKTEPKFSAPVELKGDVGTPAFAVPSAWDVDYGLRRGNFYGYATVVKAENDDKAAAPEGKACLKVGYMPSPNKIMPPPSTYTTGFPGFSVKMPDFQAPESERVMFDAPARYFMVRQMGRAKLKVGSNYTFSFRVKGRVENAQVLVGWYGNKKLSEDKVIQGERGSADVVKNEARETEFENIKFNPGTGWSEVTKDFRVFFKEKDLKDLKETSNSVIEFSFSVPLGSEVYLDDVKLIEKP